MVFWTDEGSEFDAPLAGVWAFVGSGDHHSAAHGHRAWDRRRLPGNAGEYSWEQPFDGRPTRFTMRWTAFPPVGIAYEVLAGPFEGSVFFLYYVPNGDRTGVTVAGEFVSPTLPESELPAALARFFDREFEQDLAAIRADRAATGAPPSPRELPPGRREAAPRHGGSPRASRGRR